MTDENGSWIINGYESFEEAPLKTVEDMMEYVKKVGFVPLFRNEIPGFSIEELSYKYGWWGDNPQIDPWAFREYAAGSKEVAYGKLFFGKAGFIAKEYLPYFARVRRDGYDFDSRYEDGLASRRCKMIMDTFEHVDTLPSYELKEVAGFGKGREKGFDSTANQLQMQTYLVVSGFSRKKNKKGEEYGWAVTNYTPCEHLFGFDEVRSAYPMDLKEAARIIEDNLVRRFEQIDSKVMNKVIFG